MNKMKSEHIKELLEEADLGVEQAYQIGYEIGYQECKTIMEVAAYPNRFEGYGDDLEIAFNQGISVGFIDKEEDMAELSCQNVTLH